MLFRRRSSLAMAAAASVGLAATPRQAIADASTRPAELHRGAPYVFRAHSGRPWERDLGEARNDAWAADDGVTMITSGGNSGSLLSRSSSLVLNVDVTDLFDASFSPDLHHAALVRVRTPLVVIDVPGGTVRWQPDAGRSCGARWISPNVLLAHDAGAESHLKRVDFATDPPRVTAVGEVRGADSCWASPDGARWIVRDDRARAGGVVWLVDSLRGDAVALAQGYLSVVGSPVADRVCVERRDHSIDCIDAGTRTISTVVRAGDHSRVDIYSAIDDTGSRFVFGTAPNVMVADFASATVRAVPAITLPLGGSVALLSGGHFIATGSPTSFDLYALDDGWSMSAPVPRSYSVKPLWRRPHAFLVARGAQAASAWSLYEEYFSP